ncbi:hypothetical protein [Gordonia sp. NPDC003429]
MAQYRTSHGGEDQQIWEMYGGRVRIMISPIDVWDNGYHYVIDPTMVEGRLVCNSLLIDRLDAKGNVVSPPVATDAIRGADLSAWLSSAIEDATSERVGTDSRGNEEWATRHRFPPEDFAEAGITDESLEQLSQHYAWLMVQGRKPSGEFLRDYGLPRSTTTRWLNEARRRGILVDEHRRVK